jgi:deoxycytidine triphosphate deaminase
MGLKPDHWIKKMALEHKMIEPFEDGQKRDGVISYGVSSYGYDIRPWWIQNNLILPPWWIIRGMSVSFRRTHLP